MKKAAEGKEERGKQDKKEGREKGKEANANKKREKKARSSIFVKIYGKKLLT